MRALLLAIFLLLPALAAAAPAGEKVTVGPERVRACLEEFVAGKKNVLPQAAVRFRTLDLPPPFTVPAGDLACEVVPADPRILPSRRFTLLFRVDGQVVRNFSVSGELEAVAPVVVAAGELPRGAVLGEKDLNVVERDLAGLRNPCLDPKELIGKTLKRPVRLGEPFDRGAVEFPPLVKRGDVVAITASRKGLTATATGMALQEGKKGETITVRNSSSQKDILCRVAGPGAVEVEF